MGDAIQLKMVGYKKGAFIFVEDDIKNDSFYIVVDGKVKTYKGADYLGEPEILSKGDFFGVITCMSGHLRIDTAEAMTDVNLLEVKKEQYKELIQKNSPLALKIIKQFSQKMRQLDDKLAKISLQSEKTSDTVFHLYDVGEYYLKSNQLNLAFHAFYRYLQYVSDSINTNEVKEKLIRLKPLVKDIALQIDNRLIRNYSPNVMIFSEGEPGNEMFVIKKGNVKILKIIQKKEVLLALLKPGDIFGEMALLENKVRSASAITAGEVELMAVNKQNFETMSVTQPDLIVRLTNILSERIWFAYKQLENAYMLNPLGKLYHNLVITLEKNKIDLNLSTPYQFEITPEDLVSMTGIKGHTGSEAIDKLTNDPNIVVEAGKIKIKSIKELHKQGDYYKKMFRIEENIKKNKK